MNTRLPLFPLDMVLFPSVPMPLHIFEERYRLLVNRCIDEGTPFGVVYHKGESLRDVGCTAVVEQVVKRYDDGRLDIVTVGDTRFRILEMDDTGPYIEAEVHYFQDQSPSDDRSLITLAVDEILRYAFFSELALEREALEALTENQLSYMIAGLDALGMDAKQELLEIDTPTDRLREAHRELEVANNQMVEMARLGQALGTDVDLRDLMN